MFEKPKDENAKIWRYMDFTKFISLLDKSALYFTRADKLNDPFEGSYSKANVKLRPEVYKNIPDKALKELSAFHKNIIKYTAINCWHLNEYESAAMWKLYLKSNEGIAITSTFSRLKSSFKENSPNIFIGMVKYIDYERDWLPEGNTFYPFVHKRTSFEYEKELRAVIQEFSNDWSKLIFNDGIYISVDLKILIDKIYLAPTCPKWLFDLVKSLAMKFELEKEVLQSTLDNEPVY